MQKNEKIQISEDKFRARYYTFISCIKQMKEGTLIWAMLSKDILKIIFKIFKEQHYWHVANISILGNNKVDKTKLAHRLAYNSYEVPADIRVVGPYYARVFANLKLYITDVNPPVTGLDHFTTRLLPQIIFLTFNITDRDSFTKVQAYMRDADRHASDKALRLLVGLKSDLSDNRVVTIQEAKQLASANSIDYYEVSAFNGENVNQMLTDVANKMHSKIQIERKAAQTGQGAAASKESINSIFKLIDDVMGKHEGGQSFNPYDIGFWGSKKVLGNGDNEVTLPKSIDNFSHLRFFWNCRHIK